MSVGNGGVHAYDVTKLLRRRPTSAADAFNSYAKNSKGAKAIYRAPIRTARRRASARRTCSSRSPARTGSSWAGTRRAPRSWTSPRTRTARSTSRRPATSSRPARTSGSRTSSRSTATPTELHLLRHDRRLRAGIGGSQRGRGYKVTLPAPPAPTGGRLEGTGPGFQPTPCLASSVKIGRKNIGRLKLGQGKKATARRAGPPLGTISRTTRAYRYCVKKSKKARAIAVFDAKGRIRIAATNRGSHRFGKTKPGTARRPCASATASGCERSPRRPRGAFQALDGRVRPPRGQGQLHRHRRPDRGPPQQDSARLREAPGHTLTG